MFSSDHEQNVKALETLKNDQEEFRKKSLRDSKAILAREAADRSESIRLLHLITRGRVEVLRDYYRKWYSKDSTAENVVATVLYKFLAQLQQDKYGFFSDIYQIDNSFKLHFGTKLLEELKRVVLEDNKKLILIKDIDQAITTPLSELIQQHKERILVISDVRKMSTSVKDTMAIFAFLADDERFFAQLDVIEERLKVSARKRCVLNEADNSLHGYEEGQPFKHNKLLFGCLRQLAEECGYKGYAKVYSDELTSQEFNVLLTQGYAFKDTAVRGPTHGEEGHLLQLICLGLEYKNQAEKFLTKHPIQLFSDLKEELSNIALTLFWNANFELATPITSESYHCLIPSNIGRSVFKLHEYLTHPKGAIRYPLLHQLIKSRDFKPTLTEEKRQQVGAPFTVTLFSSNTTT